MNSIQDKSTLVKPAAIWARVSTSNQSETSLPSQVSRCQDRLQQAGYKSIQTFAVDWGSLDLWSCPEFQELRRLIENGEIEALCIYDRDRLEAKGRQRLVFLADLKDAGVKLLVCNGAEILEGPEGELVELALAIGKERSVLRARQGSRDGLADRATKRHLPVTFHKVYGYQWDKEKLRLVPNEQYGSIKLIFQLLNDGLGYVRIIGELEKRGILSPSGNPKWNETAISAIARNPIYAGRYFALKKQAIEPKKRNGNTYGNTSTKRLPLSESVYIPEIEIIEPPVTWNKREQLLKQIISHQKLSSRNAKHDYLLRGLIFCEEHGRRYHGRPKNKTYYYCCPVGGCKFPYVDGPRLDDWVKYRLSILLTTQSDELYNAIGSNHKLSEKSLKAELAKLEKDYQKQLQSEAGLEERYQSGQIDKEVYPLLKTKVQVVRKGIKSREDEILTELAMIGREKEVVESIERIKSEVVENPTMFDEIRAILENKPTKIDEIKSRIISNIEDDNTLSTEKWREIFSRLNLTIIVKAEQRKQPPASIYEELEHPNPLYLKKTNALEVPGPGFVNVNGKKRREWKYIPLDLNIGVPVNSDVLSIVSANPGVGLHNQQSYFPIKLSEITKVLAGGTVDG